MNLIISSTSLCIFAISLVLLSPVHAQKSSSGGLKLSPARSFSKTLKFKLKRGSKTVYDLPKNVLFKDAIKSSKVPVPPEVRKIAGDIKYKRLFKSLGTIEKSVKLTDRLAVTDLNDTGLTDDLSPSVRQLACLGPGFGSGMMLTPAQSFFSPAAAVPCLPAQAGPPFLCLCRYGCGQFLFVRYCFFVCGSVGELKFGFGPGFTCKINGVEVPQNPGIATCPLTPETLCSA